MASSVPYVSSSAALNALHTNSASPLKIPTQSTAVKNSTILCGISSQSTVSRKAIIVSSIPIIQVDIVSPRSAKSKVVKNSLIPVAIDTPKLVQSNVVPNESRKCNTVLSAPAMVLPSAPNNSGEIKPFKNSASPVPKLSAALYTDCQFIEFNESVIAFPIYAPKS